MNANPMPSAAQWENKRVSNGCITTEINLHTTRLIDIKELTRLTGDSRSGAYNKMNPRSEYYDEDHPVGVRLGKHAVRYRLDEVLAYIASRPRVRNIGQ